MTDDLASKEVHPEVIRLAFVLSPMLVGHPVIGLASKAVRPELGARVVDLVDHVEPGVHAAELEVHVDRVVDLVPDLAAIGVRVDRAVDLAPDLVELG